MRVTVSGVELKDICELPDWVLVFVFEMRFLGKLMTFSQIREITSP